MGWPFLFKPISDRSNVTERRRPQDKREGPIGRGQRSEQDRPDWQKRVHRDRDIEKSPLVPSQITPDDLDMGVRVQLKTLTAENAEMVARHLAMVSLLIDDDPTLAHKHALAASRRASRLAVVHETLGLTAYAIGDFALALRELLTHRRLSGSNDQLPIIVDSERGMGRPERALEAVVGIDRSKLPVGVRINLAIALSGARLDLGQTKLAKQELEIKELSPKQVFEQSPLLFRSYAEVLRELGADAQEWDELADRAERALSEAGEEVFNLVEEIEIPTSSDFERKPRREYTPRAGSDRAPRTDRSGERGAPGRRDFTDRPRRDSGDRPSEAGRGSGRAEFGRRTRDESDGSPRDAERRYPRRDSSGRKPERRVGAERSGRGSTNSPEGERKFVRREEGSDKPASERYFGKGDGTNRPKRAAPKTGDERGSSGSRDRQSPERGERPRPSSDRKFVKRDGPRPASGRSGQSPRGYRGKTD